MNMSVKNDIIALNEVVKQTTDLLKEQSTSWRSIVDEVKKINQSAPSSYIKMQKELADSIAKADQVEQRYQATLSKRTQLQNKINTDVQKILNTGSSLAKQQEKEIALEAKRQAQLEKSTNTYQRVNDRVRQLTQTYNDLATRQALGQKLDAQQLSQLAKLEGQLQAYDKILKQVDATIGKNNRNVGNYRSGFDGLGNSINQITRELPAFTFSAQTGFLALSNNIPILADEIQRVSANVKEMRAQGQQVPGVMSQILTSFLSWQTALSLAVTLITVYGKEIGEFFTEVFQGSKKIDSAKIALASYNEALKSGDYKKAYEDVTRVGLAFEQARKGTISKKEALEVYNNTLGDVMGRTNDFNKAEAIYNSQADKYIQATLAKASANHLFAKSAELNAQKVELLNQKEFSWLDKRKNEFKNLFQNTSQYSSQALSEMENVKKATKIDEEINANKEAIKGFFADYEKASNGLNTGNFFGGSTNTGGNSNSSTSNKDAEDLTKDRIQSEYELQTAIINRAMAEAKYAEDNEAYYAKQIELINLTYEHNVRISDLEIKDAEVLKNTKEKYLQEQLKSLEDVTREELELIQKKTDDQMKAEQSYLEFRLNVFKQVREAIDQEIEKQKQADDKRKEGFKDYAKGGFSFSSLGFGSLDVFQDVDFMKDFWKTMEDDSVSAMEKAAAATRMFGDITKDVFNAISERQNAYYEQQFANLEKEKDVAIQFAGDSTTAREAIETQYEEKKIQLQREQAKKQKQMAIFNAIVNTAQGVVSMLANVPWPANLVMAGLVGALGAVQIANIASTPLPQFEVGTDNAPQGWAITQEKGAEMITDKHGNIKTLGNNKGNQLTYLNKGDKVYTADETTQRINEMLLGTGVAPIVNTNVNSGLTKDDMFDVMQQTLAKQPSNHITMDEYGFKRFITKGNSKTNFRNRNVKI